MSLNIINKFFLELNQNEIKYVHWKSNLNLHNALLGDDDLDILVHPDDKSKLLSVFKYLKIIRAYSNKDSWQKGVFHYYALDESTAQIVHIHLHYQLPIGFDYNKNYIIPINDSIFKESVKLHNVNISCPEHEYILLILRLLIKNAATPFLLANPIRQIKIILGDKIIPKNALQEFTHLKNIIDRKKLNKLLEYDLKYIDLELFIKCERIIEQNTSIIIFLRLARELKHKLKPFRDNKELKSFIVSFARINKSRLFNLKNKFLKSKIKGSKTPEHGGRIYAFVGGDGAGKSTNIKLLKKKLAQNLKTTNIHIGKPPKSFAGGFLYYKSRILKRIGLISTAKLIMSMRLAIDRKRAFQKAEKLRAKGVIVILDRIPTEGISVMDAPSIDSTKYPRIAKLEQKKYSKIKGVDLLFVMKLNPEIALKRRPEDNPENLRIRSGQVWNGVWDKSFQIITDTGKLDFFEVEQRILSNVWSNLITPFRKIELVGISGTGKSTLQNNFTKQHPNSIAVFSKKEYKYLAILNIINNPKGFCYSLFPNHKNINNRIKYIIDYNMLVVNKHLNKKYYDKNFILDQSIIYLYMIAIKEKFLSEEDAIQSINKLDNFFDFIILLKAPSELLFERIKARKKQGIGRAKNKNYEEFLEFYNQYNQVFNLLNKTKLKIIEIDTSTVSIDEMIKSIDKYYN